MSKLLFDGAVATFLEDKAMVEAQQKNLEGNSLDGLIDINADTAQLQVRRMLSELIAQENARAQRVCLTRPSLASNGIYEYRTSNFSAMLNAPAVYEIPIF